MVKKEITMGDLTHLPYAFTSLLAKRKNPNLEDDFFPKNICLPNSKATWLQKKNRMKDKYLGACLDKIRWGSQTTVLYKMPAKKLVAFIASWMEQNKGNLGFHEYPTVVEVPLFQYDKCPECGDTKFIRDRTGRLRCAHKSEKQFRPSFVNSCVSFDELTQTNRVEFYENKPHDLLPDDAWNKETGDLDHYWKEELEKYGKEGEKFEQENPTFIVTDFCYSILSDIENKPLSLEEIIDRKNIFHGTRIFCNDRNNCKDKVKDEDATTSRCSGHTVYDKCKFPFDGWTLAWYVEAWYNQEPKGTAPLYRKGKSLTKNYKHWFEKRPFGKILSIGERVYENNLVYFDFNEVKKINPDDFAFKDILERKEWTNYIQAMQRESGRKEKGVASNPHDRTILEKMLIDYGRIDKPIQNKVEASTQIEA